MPTLKFKITLSSHTTCKWRIQGYIPNLCDFRVLVMCLIPLWNHGKPTFQKNNAFRQKRNCKWVNKDVLTWSRIGSIMEYFYFGCFCFLHGALGQQMHPFFTCEVPTPPHNHFMLMVSDLHCLECCAEKRKYRLFFFTQCTIFSIVVSQLFPYWKEDIHFQGKDYCLNLPDYEYL